MIFEVHPILLWVSKAVNNSCRNDRVLNSLIHFLLQVAGQVRIGMDHRDGIQQVLGARMRTAAIGDHENSYLVHSVNEFLTLGCFVAKFLLLQVIADLYPTLDMSTVGIQRISTYKCTIRTRFARIAFSHHQGGR